MSTKRGEAMSRKAPEVPIHWNVGTKPIVKSYEKLWIVKRIISNESARKSIVSTKQILMEFSNK